MERLLKQALRANAVRISDYMANHTTLDAKASTPFFSAIPRGVMPFLASGQIKGREAALLIVLLDYKNKNGMTVSPSQDELSRRLNCSPDTIQRAAARLKAVGLISWTRVRNAWGRLGKCIYDLSAVFALMPRRAADLRHGKFGGSESEATPQDSGPPKVDSCSVKADKAADNNTQAEMTPEAAAVVVDLASQGVDKKVAHSLAQKHGADKCRAALALAKKSKGKIQSLPGWLRRAVENGWGVSAESAPKPPCASPVPAPGQSGSGGHSGITGQAGVGAALPPACQLYRPAWKSGAEQKETQVASDNGRQSFQEAKAWLKKKAGRL